MNYRIDYWNKKEADPMKFLSIFRCTTEPIGGGTEEDDEGELVDWDAAVIAVDKTKEQMIEKACKWWDDYLTYPNEGEFDKKNRAEMIDAFKKAMENQN